MAKRKNYSRMKRLAITWLAQTMRAEGWADEYPPLSARDLGTKLIAKQYPKLPAGQARNCALAAMDIIEREREVDNEPSDTN